MCRSFLLTLLLVMIVATYYQLRIDERRLVAAPPIPAISAKCDAAAKNGDYEAAYYGKPFELFQMRPLGSNGIVSVESNALDTQIDLNGNRQRHGDPSAESAETLPGDGTATTSMGGTGAGKQPGRTELTDYQVETGSCAGVAGTYEAEQPIGVYFKYVYRLLSIVVTVFYHSSAPAAVALLCTADKRQGHSEHRQDQGGK